jgi:hypothetical protein
MNIAVTLALCCLAADRVGPMAPPEDVKAVVAKGLDYLVRQQTPDGTWSAAGGQFSTALTALAATALFMEGSSQRDGKYAPQLRKALSWFEKQARPNGMIGSNDPSEQGRYMLGHGFAMMFLAMAYVEEEDRDRRSRLEKILQNAVTFTAKAQTNRGGWGYVTAADGNNFDEGHATIVVLHGLRATRNAGIPVPKEVLAGALKYLEGSTNAQGGIIYSQTNPGGEGRPIITAGAAALYASGSQTPKFADWVKFVAQRHVPAGNRGDDLLQFFYFARVAYVLGEDGHRKIDPQVKENEAVRWSAYRKVIFTHLKGTQKEDGSWENAAAVGPMLGTPLALIVLQLENGTVPFFAR